MKEFHSERNTDTEVSLSGKVFSFFIVVMMLGSVYLFPFFEEVPFLCNSIDEIDFENL